MIGNFKPNVDKHVLTTSVCITTDSIEAMFQNIKNNSTFIKHFEVGKKYVLRVFKLILIFPVVPGCKYT